MGSRKDKRDALSYEWDAALDATSVFISIHDRDYRIVKVNAALAALLQKEPAQIVGRRCFEVVHGVAAPPERCPHTRALRTGNHQKEEFFEPHLGIRILVSVSPLFTRDGRVSGSIHVAKYLGGAAAAPNPAAAPVLTERQKQILNLFCNGRVAKEIAFQLNISPRTVEYHKYQMMKKFSARSFSELVARVLTGDVI